MTNEERPQIEDQEICNECGKSVVFGSGKFVNRVPDFNDYETRVQMNKPYPQGAFMCAECDAECPLDTLKVYPVEQNGEWVSWIVARSLPEAIDKDALGGDVFGGFDKETLEKMIQAIDEYEPEETDPCDGCDGWAQDKCRDCPHEKEG